MSWMKQHVQQFIMSVTEKNAISMEEQARWTGQLLTLIETPLSLATTRVLNSGEFSVGKTWKERQGKKGLHKPLAPRRRKERGTVDNVKSANYSLNKRRGGTNLQNLCQSSFARFVLKCFFLLAHFTALLVQSTAFFHCVGCVSTWEQTFNCF